MDFADKIKELADQFNKIKDHVVTEEATKNAMVMPFLQTLGYDIFNPLEVIPEYTSAWVKSDARVDYAIFFNEEPTILIEVKKVRVPLQFKDLNMLFQYYAATKSKFAILTNGIQYQFFADLDKKHIMDERPFLVLDIAPSIRDSEILELQKFCKEKFNPGIITSGAEILKYTGEIKRFFREQIKEPDEEFTRFFIKHTSFPGKAMGPIVKYFSPIVANAFKQYSEDVVGDTVKAMYEKTKIPEIVEPNPVSSQKDELRHRFWIQLLEYAKTKTDLHFKASPRKGGWIGAGSGVPGLGYCYSITKHRGKIEIYIDRGKDRVAENRKIFENLLTAKKEIEHRFGEQLEWEPLENKQACRISKIISGGGYLDEQDWPKIQEMMVNAMIRLEKALSPQIQNIKKDLG